MAIRNRVDAEVVVCRNSPAMALVLIASLSMGGAIESASGMDQQPQPDAPDRCAGPWQRHTITAISHGADGVDLRDSNDDGLPDIVTPWEEGGEITVSLHPPAGSDPREPWPTSIVAGGIVGVEDAKFADLDADGALDVISASDAGARLHAHFAGAPWTTITIDASLGHNRWMQVASADVDGDGDLDIVAGSRAGTATNPAVIAWFDNPGPERARNGAEWTYHEMTKAGWTMSVLAVDVDGDGDPDTVVSDRASFRRPDNSVSWSLYGARWIETIRGDNKAPSFVNHPIEIAGSCAVCTPGDEMFVALHDIDGDGVLDLIDGTSSASRPNRIVIHRNLGFWGPPASWSYDILPPAADVGHYQGVAAGDVDGDGMVDLVVSTWEANSLPASSRTGVYWYRNLGGGAWKAMELSGPEGTKYDNVVLSDLDADGDLDVITAEQVENQGVIWFENPGIGHDATCGRYGLPEAAVQ